MSTKAQFLGVLALAVGLAGCALDGRETMVEGDNSVHLFVRNETDREVAIVVDGVESLQVAAGQRLVDQQLILPARDTYAVAARTETGYVLGSFTTDTQAWFGAPGFIKNLRCGDLWVWVGHEISVEGIAPVPPELQESCD